MFSSLKPREIYSYMLFLEATLDGNDSNRYIRPNAKAIYTHTINSLKEKGLIMSKGERPNMVYYETINVVDICKDIILEYLSDAEDLPTIEEMPISFGISFIGAFLMLSQEDFDENLRCDKNFNCKLLFLLTDFEDRNIYKELIKLVSRKYIIHHIRTFDIISNKK